MAPAAPTPATSDLPGVQAAGAMASFPSGERQDAFLRPLVPSLRFTAPAAGAVLLRAAPPGAADPAGGGPPFPTSNRQATPAGPANSTGPPELPAGHEIWCEADRRRYVATVTLVRAWRAWRAAHANIPAQAAVAAFGLASHDESSSVAQWCRTAGLRCELRTLQRYAARLARDGNRDGRGRIDPQSAIRHPSELGAAGFGPHGCATTVPPSAPYPRGPQSAARQSAIHDPQSMSADAWERFRSLYLGGGGNALKLSQCWRFVAGEAREKGWTWPSESTVRARVQRQIPHGAQVLARRGARRFEADCVPKIERDYESILAGDWWCLDGRVLDVMIRVPDARREWRAVRPVLTGVLDLRSRSLRLDMRATECSDGILAGIKRALLDWGAPTDVICDNGEAYKTAAGHRRGSLWQRWMLSDPQVASVFAALGATLHQAIPFHPWAKPFESIWSKVKEGFDRWLLSFWGGAPAERPEGRAAEIKRRIDKLPTEADLRRLLATYVDEYNASEQSGAGTCGLCPNLVMEQYRGTIRPVSPDLAAFLCARPIEKPVKVMRDGVCWRGAYYGGSDQAVWPLQGRRVRLRIDPDRADRVMLCDLAGAPLCYAHAAPLAGATQEQRREAARLQAQYRRIMAQAAAARDYLRQTPTAQVLGAKRRHALAAQAAARATLPAPEPPALALVCPQRTAQAAAFATNERRRTARRQAQSAAGLAVEGASSRPENGFDLLAQIAAPPPVVPRPTMELWELVGQQPAPVPAPPVVDWETFLEAAG